MNRNSRSTNRVCGAGVIALLAIACVACAPQARAEFQSSDTPAFNSPAVQSPAFKPELFEMSLDAKNLSTASKPDLWDDHADRLRYRSNFSIWASSVSGNVGKGDFETDVDVSFSDLLKDLSGALSLDFEVGKGPLALIVFGMYNRFEADAQTPRGFDADAKSQFALIDIAIAYELFRVPVGSAPDSAFSVEALVGFRWTYLSAEIDINEGPFAGRSEDREKNWFDPYVGTRLRYDLDRNWNISAIGTIGGFGVGSDLCWSAYAQLEYRFNEKFSFILGYRAINYDYEDDGFVFDVTLHGPVIGLGFRH